MFLPRSTEFFSALRGTFFSCCMELFFLLRGNYSFAEKPETRRFFMDLQQTFIDWNDKPSSSPDFASLKDALLAKIAAAEK